MSDRGLTSAMETAIAAGEVKPFWLAYFDFSGGAIRVTTLGSDLSWNSLTWQALGSFGTVDPPEESGEVANPCVFRLTGVPSDMIAAALENDYSGRDCELYFGCLDASDLVVVDPYAVWTGVMNYIEVDRGPETSVITLYADGAEVDLRKAKLKRYSNEDQQADYSGDDFFEYAPWVATSNPDWGIKGAGNRFPRSSALP